jgi:hypothetical protein
MSLVFRDRPQENRNTYNVDEYIYAIGVVRAVECQLYLSCERMKDYLCVKRTCRSTLKSSRGMVVGEEEAMLNHPNPSRHKTNVT